MNSNLHKPKEQLHLLWPQNYCCHWHFSHLFNSFCVLSSAARKFTLQTRLLRILLTLFSQHYCLKCVYSELAKFLPSKYFQASDLKRNKKLAQKLKMSMTETWEQRDIWNSVQGGQHEGIIIVWQKKSGWLTLEWKLFLTTALSYLSHISWGRDKMQNLVSLFLSPAQWNIASFSHFSEMLFLARQKTT